MSNQNNPPLCLDVSLEEARALHRVWRALNDGDCPKCHYPVPATSIKRDSTKMSCPNCDFHVTFLEICDIERMFAPAMDAAVGMFERWRNSRETNQNEPIIFHGPTSTVEEAKEALGKLRESLIKKGGQNIYAPKTSRPIKPKGQG